MPIQDLLKYERDWLKEDYLPLLDGKILFVGVASYTKDYHTYVKEKTIFDTIDHNPKYVKFGSPDNHINGDFLKYKPNFKYDHICLFGVLGHRSSSKAKYNLYSNIKTFKHASRLLTENGSLLIGPSYKMVRGYNLEYWDNVFNTNRTISNWKRKEYLRGEMNLILWIEKR